MSYGHNSVARANSQIYITGSCIKLATLLAPPSSIFRCVSEQDSDSATHIQQQQQQQLDSVSQLNSDRVAWASVERNHSVVSGPCIRQRSCAHESSNCIWRYIHFYLLTYLLTFPVLSCRSDCELILVKWLMNARFRECCLDHRSDSTTIGAIRDLPGWFEMTLNLPRI